MNSSLPTLPSTFGIQSTAGAVPVKNDKGEVSMQKVKVHRYVSGKRPEYAQQSSSEDESDEEDFLEKRQQSLRNETLPPDDQVPDLPDDDPRLRRLKTRKFTDNEGEEDGENRFGRHRHVHEPEIMEADDIEDNYDQEEDNDREYRRGRLPGLGIGESSEEEEEEELSDEEIEKRRKMLREKVLTKKEDEMEVLDKEDEGKSAEESAEESSEYEEYTDSEEDTGPRLKPVFIRKKDRVTVIEKEKEAQKQKQLEQEAKKMAEERRRYTLKLVEEEVRKETNKVRGNNNDEIAALNDVNTDDENDEVEYEAWKLRELKRIKRDREERELLEKERMEIEKLRNMTEEERRQELRINPKILTNKATKGKYKFMQKYYHRGVFFLDQDEELLKRDFSAATLEDHFDKTILPKVMQVKNFGRSGRTKYTHLVDQDTTHFDSPWVSETAQNLKFHNNQAAGMRQVFEKPSVKKRKT
ncbi:microfibril-associated protein 1 [Lycorma delicatula]|uniref:microfibril-associated protein 1 n=1 Tax=Lycorma delicatula TaxID=130591 RepID=UPI003F50DB26